MPGTSLRVADCVYYGLDSFKQQRQVWRITHHMRRVEDTLDIRSHDFIDKIILESREKSRAQQRLKGLPADRRYRLMWCKQDEATHVCLVAVSCAIAPVEECEFIREVEWSQERIAQERINAASDFWLKNYPTDWFWE